MKSIKPGRGPSFLSGIMSICVGLFGVVWTVAAASMGGGIFVIFGVMFVVFAIASGAYNLYNAKAKKRFSTFDITENGEEPDPFNEQFSNDVKPNNQNKTGMFCPYCGTKFENDHAFCKNCGKKLQ